MNNNIIRVLDGEIEIIAENILDIREYMHFQFGI